MAKVVGVTTDTISRWENNRYPSIKRENALRLAEALEASVEEILQEGTGACSVEESIPTVPRSPYRLIPFFLVPVLLAGVFFWVQNRQTPSDVLMAERILPGYAAPESVIPVP